jgi:hypothetical protein
LVCKIRKKPNEKAAFQPSCPIGPKNIFKKCLNPVKKVSEKFPSRLNLPSPPQKTASFRPFSNENHPLASLPNTTKMTKTWLYSP